MAKTSCDTQCAKEMASVRGGGEQGEEGEKIKGSLNQTAPKYMEEEAHALDADVRSLC